MATTAADVQTTMASTFGFSKMDLEANRQGHIAETQFRTLLARAAEFWTIVAVALVPLWLTVAFLFLKEEEAFARLWLGAFWLMLTLHIGWYFGPVSQLVQLVLDLTLDRRAECVEGKLHTSVSTEATEEPVDSPDIWSDEDDRQMMVHRPVHRERNWLVIGGEQFAVSRRALRAYHPYSGSTCRVWVTKRSRMLLSFELVTVRISRLY